jgi:hypothetical protein
MMQARALLRELADVSTVLTIIAAPTHVTITSDRGTIRKFTPGDRVGSIWGPRSHGQVGWDEDMLTVDWTAGKAKFTESYQVGTGTHARDPNRAGRGKEQPAPLHGAPNHLRPGRVGRF